MRHAAYDAIIFDVGGTLLNVVRDPHQMAIDAIAQLGPVPVDAFRAGIRQAVAEWNAAGGLAEQEDLPETWERHYRRALTLAGFGGDVGAAAHLMEDSFLSEGWEVYADAPTALGALHDRGVRMGVVSNWSATLETTLQRASLHQYFAVIVSSATVGYAKPHSRIFQIAAERLGVTPSRTLYVGDSIAHDVIGATAAGMEALLLDRSGAHDAHAPRLRSLSELPALLELRS